MGGVNCANRIARVASAVAKEWSSMFRRSRRLPEDSQKSEDPGSKKPEDSAVRLPLRWGLILLASCLAAVVVNSVAGPAAAIGTGIAVAVGLDRMLA
jgi:hypothetical protein